MQYSSYGIPERKFLSANSPRHYKIYITRESVEAIQEDALSLPTYSKILRDFLNLENKNHNILIREKPELYNFLTDENILITPTPLHWIRNEEVLNINKDSIQDFVFVHGM